MGVRILEGNGEGDSRGAVLYCSTSGWAFGPVFEDYDEAAAFLEWNGRTDVRLYDDAKMEERVSRFRSVREAWEKERAEADSLEEGDYP